MATYRGSRYDEFKVAVTVNGVHLDTRRDLLHGAFEFDAGPLGIGGQSQLAVALLADHFRRCGVRKAVADRCALRLFREFRKKVIEPIDADEFTLTSEQIADVLAAL